MRKEEQRLFKELCKLKKEELDGELTAYATPHVLGQLFFNRMQGGAYRKLQQCGLLGKVNREFRNSLQSAYEQNCRKNESFFACVNEVSALLACSDVPAAMLKGAWLCAHEPEGTRTSNDIDLLVAPEDVTAVGQLLKQAGFRQGSVKNGTFIPASRREIIESKMMRGETVPYIKEVGRPGMNFLEVDVNFSLDYKNSDGNILRAMLEQADWVSTGAVRIPTLCKEDFFLHLCGHLYKEATTLPWVEMKRDMTLYKYCDIDLLLEEFSDADVVRLFCRALKLGLDKICAFAILQTAELFDIGEDRTAVRMSREALSGHPEFLHQVISPGEKKLLVYQTKNITDRFFMEDRAADLREVTAV